MENTGKADNTPFAKRVIKNSSEIMDVTNTILDEIEGLERSTIGTPVEKVPTPGDETKRDSSNLMGTLDGSQEQTMYSLSHILKILRRLNEEFEMD